jgi:Domain of unknown function (DUF5668)
MTTEQPPNPSPEEPTAPLPQPPPAEPRTFEQRMDDFGKRAGAAGEKLGREAEVAAQRWKKDPAIAGAADTATRVWGLIVLAIGLWFLADFTLGLDMPDVAWRDIWPVGLIIIGLAVLIRGMASRRA